MGIAVGGLLVLGAQGRALAHERRGAQDARLRVHTRDGTRQPAPALTPTTFPELDRKLQRRHLGATPLPTSYAKILGALHEYQVSDVERILGTLAGMPATQWTDRAFMAAVRDSWDRNQHDDGSRYWVHKLGTGHGAPAGLSGDSLRRISRLTPQKLLAELPLLVHFAERDEPGDPPSAVLFGRALMSPRPTSEKLQLLRFGAHLTGRLAADLLKVSRPTEVILRALDLTDQPAIALAALREPALPDHVASDLAQRRWNKPAGALATIARKARQYRARRLVQTVEYFRRYDPLGDDTLKTIEIERGRAIAPREDKIAAALHKDPAIETQLTKAIFVALREHHDKEIDGLQFERLSSNVPIDLLYRKRMLVLWYLHHKRKLRLQDQASGREPLAPKLSNRLLDTAISSVKTDRRIIHLVKKLAAEPMAGQNALRRVLIAPLDQQTITRLKRQARKRQMRDGAFAALLWEPAESSAAILGYLEGLSPSDSVGIVQRYHRRRLEWPDLVRILENTPESKLTSHDVAHLVAQRMPSDLIEPVQAAVLAAATHKLTDGKVAAIPQASWTLPAETLGRVVVALAESETRRMGAGARRRYASRVIERLTRYREAPRIVARYLGGVIWSDQVHEAGSALADLVLAPQVPLNKRRARNAINKLPADIQQLPRPHLVRVIDALVQRHGLQDAPEALRRRLVSRCADKLAPEGGVENVALGWVDVFWLVDRHKMTKLKLIAELIDSAIPAEQLEPLRVQVRAALADPSGSAGAKPLPSWFRNLPVARQQLVVKALLHKALSGAHTRTKQRLAAAVIHQLGLETPKPLAEGITWTDVRAAARNQPRADLPLRKLIAERLPEKDLAPFQSLLWEMATNGSPIALQHLARVPQELWHAPAEQLQRIVSAVLRATVGRGALANVDKKAAALARQIGERVALLDGTRGWHAFASLVSLTPQDPAPGTVLRYLDGCVSKRDAHELASTVTELALAPHLALTNGRRLDLLGSIPQSVLELDHRHLVRVLDAMVQRDGMSDAPDGTRKRLVTRLAAKIDPHHPQETGDLEWADVVWIVGRQPEASAAHVAQLMGLLSSESQRTLKRRVQGALFNPSAPLDADALPIWLRKLPIADQRLFIEAALRDKVASADPGQRQRLVRSVVHRYGLAPAGSHVPKMPWKDVMWAIRTLPRSAIPFLAHFFGDSVSNQQLADFRAWVWRGAQNRHGHRTAGPIPEQIKALPFDRQLDLICALGHTRLRRIPFRRYQRIVMRALVLMRPGRSLEPGDPQRVALSAEVLRRQREQNGGVPKGTERPPAAPTDMPQQEAVAATPQTLAPSNSDPAEAQQQTDPAEDLLDALSVYAELLPDLLDAEEALGRVQDLGGTPQAQLRAIVERIKFPDGTALTPRQSASLQRQNLTRLAEKASIWSVWRGAGVEAGRWAHVPKLRRSEVIALWALSVPSPAPHKWASLFLSFDRLSQATGRSIEDLAVSFSERDTVTGAVVLRELARHHSGRAF